MSIRIRRFGRLAAVLVALVALGTLAAPVAAQVTTGGLAGQVISQADRSALPGVAIEAIHVPTGTRYTAVTNESGRFTFVNARVGGPYTVTATLEGFSPLEAADVYVGLGDVTNLAFELTLDTVEEIIEVVGSADALISADRTGSSTSVSLDMIEALPTVRRQLQDYARLNPYFAVDPSDPNATRLSVAGKNNRYNTIQIDGAVNNDLFGLADTGTPGGQADAQPINLDAIQELQLVVSPYDVRQGGFTGGGINAITRSGANKFSGSIYGSIRDQDYVGDGPFDREIANFDEDQYGARLGGPILRDKLFFFASVETNEREQPTGVSANNTTSTQFNNPALAAGFRDLLISRYGYDPGTLGDFPAVTESDLAFVRFDWNVSPSNSVTLRHNYVDALRDVVADRSSTSFRFDTGIYAFASETNSTVLQLNSIFGANAFNEARLGYQTIKEERATPVTFPTVDIGPVTRRPQVTAGTERFSGANALDQDILELTNDFTLVRGDHTLVIGTHNEFFQFENLFLSDFYGWYKFNTLEDFERGVASDYSISFATGSDPRRPTSFEVEQYGLYLGDQWRVNDDLSLTFGVRADFPRLVDKPTYNPLIESALGIDNSQVPDNEVTVSPRIGFNWSPGERGNQQVRGGLGIFAGRTPYVWISNAYANTGVELVSLSARNVPFVSDPFNQPKNFAPGTSAISVDLVDKDFQFPQVLRATLGYDRVLPWDIRATLEAMWTQTQEDVFYENRNKVPTGQRTFDGRPIYTNRSNSLRDALYMTNTSKGEQLNASLRLTKRFDFGLLFDASYAWMDAESAMDATSSRAISNWQFRPTWGDIYEQDVAPTNWEVEHRFTIALAQSFNLGRLANTVALYYNAQSGFPYSVLQGGTDINNDGYNSNDLLWVAANPSDIVLRNTTWAEYDAWAKSLGLKRGAIQGRNDLQARWNRTLDFHYDIELPISMVRTQLTFDILNLINFIDSDKGLVEYVNFGTFTPLNYRGIDSATGKPIYEPAFNGALSGDRQYSSSDLRSRWQMKLGLRLSF